MIAVDPVEMTEAEFIAKMSDPFWRITSGAIYKIMVKGDDDGDALVLPFIPNEHQLELLDNFHNRNVILKARQLGFTTLIAILFLDCALFRDNVRAGVIAQTEDVAKSLFRDKVKFAYDNLPPLLKKAMPLQRDSASELLFAHNNSSIRVSVSMRGGTLQYLHVSEFGKICAEYPARAQEVLTGSIPAVAPSGIIFIESTAEGQDGAFFSMTEQARKVKDSGRALTKKDYKFHFFPWWGAAEYRVSVDNVLITDKDHEYFDKIEASAGCTIDPEQRAWWCATRDTDFAGQPERMWQEYPSTPEEAFQQSTEGCYYTVQMTAARKQQRITDVPYVAGVPVLTFWDIGNSDGTAIWLYQRIGQQDRFIGFIEAWGEPFAYFVQKLQATGYQFGGHYLPHDGAHMRQGVLNNLSPKVAIESLGLRNVQIVPRVNELTHGIQATRDALANCWFDEVACKEGLAHLELYKKRWIATTGTWSSEPLKDVHTEAADAFRQFAQSLPRLNVVAAPKSVIIPSRQHHWNNR
jgi:hypothetical protein